MNIFSFCGGNSGEQEAPLGSASSVANHLDRTKYRVAAAGIDKARHHPDIFNERGGPHDARTSLRECLLEFQR